MQVVRGDDGLDGNLRGRVILDAPLHRGDAGSVAGGIDKDAGAHQVAIGAAQNLRRAVGRLNDEVMGKALVKRHEHAQVPVIHKCGGKCRVGALNHPGNGSDGHAVVQPRHTANKNPVAIHGLSHETTGNVEVAFLSMNRPRAPHADVEIASKGAAGTATSRSVMGTLLLGGHLHLEVTVHGDEGAHDTDDDGQNEKHEVHPQVGDLRDVEVQELE